MFHLTKNIVKQLQVPLNKQNSLEEPSSLNRATSSLENIDKLSDPFLFWKPHKSGSKLPKDVVHWSELAGRVENTNADLFQLNSGLRMAHGVERSGHSGARVCSWETHPRGGRQCSGHHFDALAGADRRRCQQTNAVCPLLVRTNTGPNQLELDVQQMVHVANWALEGVENTNCASGDRLYVHLTGNSSLRK